MAGWQVMISHIDTTWRKARKALPDDPGYPFTGKDMADLRKFAANGYYGPWGLMALWDVYLAEADDYVKKAGYAINTFLRSMPRLLDRDQWKSKRTHYMEKHAPPMAAKTQQAVDLFSNLIVQKEEKR